MGSCLTSEQPPPPLAPGLNDKGAVVAPQPPPSYGRVRAARSEGPPSLRPRASPVAPATRPRCNPPRGLIHVAPGCELIVWGGGHLSGLRGRAGEVDERQGTALVFSEASVSVRLQFWQLLTHRHEVVSYYAPPRGAEVRWFFTHAPEPTLVRWSQGPGAEGRGVAVAVLRLAYKPHTRMLKDERGVGDRLPAQDWRRIASLLASGCDRSGVGHNFPIRELRQTWWAAGSAVHARWGEHWHPGCVSRVAPDGTCTVVWDEDETVTAGVPPGNIRPWCRVGGKLPTVGGQSPSLSLPAVDSLACRSPVAPEPNLVSQPQLSFDDVYEQRTKLGEGGFGEVYEVRHRVTGKAFAAKVISVCHGTRDESREIPSSSREPVGVGTRVQGLAFVDLLTVPPPGTSERDAAKIRRWLGGQPFSGVVACLVPTGSGPYQGSGVWAGVVLDVPVGSHGGTVGGVQYFEAPPHRGAFIGVEHLRPVLPHVVEISRGLQHPNLCGLVDWRGGRHAYLPDGRQDWEDEEVYGERSDNYMVCVFDICHGGTLETHLRQVPSMPGGCLEAAAAQVLGGTLQCLAHLHERGIIHHDIKVSNVLLRSPVPLGSASPGEVSLCDLGLSKFLGDPHTGGGTLLWMAPELLIAWRWRPALQWDQDWIRIAEHCGIPVSMLQEGAGYDTKVDVFAAGMLAYYVIARGRRHPFHLEGGWASLPEAEHLLRLATSATQGLSFEDPVWATVSTSCRDLITQLLQPCPTLRPSAAAALRHPWLSAQRPSRPPPPPVARSKQQLRTHETPPPDSALERLLALRLGRTVRGVKAPPRAPPRGSVKGLPLPRVRCATPLTSVAELAVAGPLPPPPRSPAPTPPGAVPGLKAPCQRPPAEHQHSGSPAPLREPGTPELPMAAMEVGGARANSSGKYPIPSRGGGGGGSARPPAAPLVKRSAILPVASAPAETSERVESMTIGSDGFTVDPSEPVIECCPVAGDPPSPPVSPP
eukprot:Hpha_TRINITY_DN5958_c0_g1::TRINITY_DN5958_c0_g1_i1::g.147285::m.147285